jgi:transmembrane sensor
MSDQPREALDRVEREAHDWLVRFASGQATPADLNEGKRWCERDPAHAAAFQRATRMWEALGPEAFQASRPAPSRIMSPVMSRRLLLGGGAAAMAASAAHLVIQPPLGLWPSWSEMAADYRTRTGERRRIVVADNAVVEMNTQTSIAMRHVAKDVAGLELISGEAMVATPPDTTARFVVTSGDGQASGSGAKFNMRNDGRSVCVTCIEGDVRVAHGAATASLHAREQVSYDRSGLGAAITIDPVTITAWQEDLLIFHAQPLRDVVTEINRYRSGKIIVVNPSLGARLFSANFRVRNVDTVVEQVQKLYGATVTSLPGGIVLLS